MKWIITGIVILLGTTAFAQNKPLRIIDGDLGDWISPMQYYDPETKLSYSIANDDSAFYFCIRATEDNTQVQLTKVGFQISIDPNGKKKQKFNLVYKPEKALPLNIKAEKPTAEKLKKEFNPLLMRVSLSGFAGIADDKYFASILKKVQVALGWDSQNFLCIEYKIPFSTMGYKPSGQNLSLGIILIAMEMPSDRMPPPGGVGGNPPSGMSPPHDRIPPQGGMTGMGDAFFEKKVWTKFKAVIPR